MTPAHFKTSRRQLLLGTLAAPLAACSRGAPQQTQAIRMGVDNRPRSLDPRFATDALSSRVNRLLYRGLTDFDAQFKPTADLATWQQLSPLQWRFQLIEQPSFHHGRRLQADDVVATLQSILDKRTASPLRGSLMHVVSVQAVGPREILFTLSKQDPLLPGRLNIGILPADLLRQGHDFNRQPVGCGPCQFEQADAQQTRLRRPDGVKLAFIKVKDPLVKVLKLRKGELDLIQDGLSPELAAYCARQPELKAQWHHGTSFAYIGFNFQDPLLADMRVRRVIAHGLDREAIVRYLFQGHARLAGGLLVPEHWAGLRDFTGYAYDPDKARALLQAAGHRLPLKLIYKTSANPLRLRLATIYQAMLRKVGIELEIQSFDWGTFYADIKAGRFQLYSLAWVGVKSPDIFQYVFHSKAVPPAGANRGRFADAEVDRLIEAALKAPDVATQAQLYRQLQQRLAEQVAMVPLWYEDQYAIQRRVLSDYPVYADGRYDGLLQVNKRGVSPIFSK